MDLIFKNVGVVGAGQMGTGIAQIIAQTGAKVYLIDQSDKILNHATNVLNQRLNHHIARHKLTQDEASSIKRCVQMSSDIRAIKKPDLIIETISENEFEKRKVLKELTALFADSALIATNTSSIPITRLATNVHFPEKFCGMHFMNPATSMGLVELVRGLSTSSQTFDLIQSFVANQLGKEVAVAEDFPGFIVNRILMPMANEAIYALYEGVGSVSSIDRAMHLGAGHPRGPLALADFIGLDTCLAILNVLFAELHDNKYRPCPLLVKYVEAGWLGIKVKRGFYDYSSEVPVPTR